MRSPWANPTDKRPDEMLPGEHGVDADEDLIEFVRPDDEFDHGLGEVDAEDVT